MTKHFKSIRILPRSSGGIRGLGFDAGGLIAAGKLLIDHVDIERSEIEKAGEYDLEGLPELPQPVREIIGDLSNPERVLIGLGVRYPPLDLQIPDQT